MASIKPSTSTEESFYQAAKGIAPAGAKTLAVRYFGEGDSGDIEGVYVDGKYNDTLSDKYSHMYDSPLIKAVCAMYFHDVSETNEGGGGEILADFTAMTVTRREYYNALHKKYVPKHEWQIW